MIAKGNNKQKFSADTKSSFKEKAIDLRRVARVVAGGKRFSFRCTLIIGDEKGNVGVGIAKGADVSLAIEKARNQAKKNIFTVPLKGTTIPHEVEAKFSAAKVLIKPAPKGAGLKAGGAVRTVLLMAGIKDASAKCLGRTKNKLTNALAAIEALKKIKHFSKEVQS
ncbi:MAG: 30S ribosomal protein S5 [Candidatus Parcubacteria bacterium]|nr:30S ribosomal protein S5 [Patescibacteria group bacterium]BCX16149.1 MAG: 30S ribosomal protein S5 [Candidatus Parcubacteria bacterium]